MKTNQCIHGDCRDVMDGMEADSIDAIVCDPPYGLKFMGKGWDHGVPGPEYWIKALRVAKPGAHLLAFGGTRMFHRLMVAIEDAGWEIRDTIMWVYGSGFPKSLDVSKALDKAAGVEREVTQAGSRKLPEDAGKFTTLTSADRERRDTAATDAARQWQGWGTALKPAYEPIIVARKPLAGTVAANVLSHGTGAINIDACRIPLSGADDAREFEFNHNGCNRSTVPEGGKLGMHDGGWKVRKGDVLVPEGRWPANLIHDGSEEVIALFPSEAGAAAPVTVRNGDKFRNTFGAFGGDIDEAGSTFRGDAGSAARFFYCAKASRADRNEGLDGHDKKPLNWSNGTENPGGFQSGGTDRSSENHHPTVKPTELMRYLCRLVTPPNGLILDPFAGSGSTGKAAVLDGFRFVGIELEAEYADIAKARIDAAIPRQAGLEFAA